MHIQSEIGANQMNIAFAWISGYAYQNCVLHWRPKRKCYKWSGFLHLWLNYMFNFSKGSLKGKCFIYGIKLKPQVLFHEFVLKTNFQSIPYLVHDFCDISKIIKFLWILGILSLQIQTFQCTISFPTIQMDNMTSWRYSTWWLTAVPYKKKF